MKFLGFDIFFVDQCYHCFQPLPRQDRNAGGVWYKIFWRRVAEDDRENEWSHEELRSMGAEAKMYVHRVERDKYFWTPYEVKIQVS